MSQTRLKRIWYMQSFFFKVWWGLLWLFCGRAFWEPGGPYLYTHRYKYRRRYGNKRTCKPRRRRKCKCPCKSKCRCVHLHTYAHLSELYLHTYIFLSNHPYISICVVCRYHIYMYGRKDIGRHPSGTTLSQLHWASALGRNTPGIWVRDRFGMPPDEADAATKRSSSGWGECEAGCKLALRV